MKLATYFSILFFSLFLLTTCNSKEKIVVEGTYFGLLPCGDCSGIDTKLILTKELNFTLETIYIGKGDEAVFTRNGTYKVEEEFLVLQNKNAPFKYKIHQKYLELLDIDGNIIKSDLNYKLLKEL